MAAPLLTVLTYHRVDDPGSRPELDPALISASPDAFERQVEWLAACTATLSLDDLLAIRRGQAEVPRRAVLVTFDDAYRDFAEHAWPALRRHGVPVTLFVPTWYPGRSGPGFWWDRLYRAIATTRRRDILVTPAGDVSLATADARAGALRLLVAWVMRTPHDDAMAAITRIANELGEAQSVAPVLSWDELRHLAAEGVALAPHSRTHPRLDRVADERRRAEVTGSRADLLREIGSCPPVFAYPAGGHDEALVRLLDREGFELAFTTQRGPNDLARPDWLRVRRANVGRRSSLPVIRALLSWPARMLSVRAVAAR